MHSLIRAGRLTGVAAAVWSGIVLLVGSLAPAAVPAALDEKDVRAALEQVQADPNLSPHSSVRTLKWAGREEREAREPPGWLEWIEGLFQWIAGVSRVLLWSVIALVLGLLVMFIVRTARNLRYGPRGQAPAAPTHVRELDIRPESLPDDIGATALALWERNEHRAALVLLYRGLLSRLVHGHSVPIRESSTEADCLQLSVPCLHADAASYVAGLIRVWQHAIYGAREPAAEEIRTLCTRFDGMFPAPAPSHAGQA